MPPTASHSARSRAGLIIPPILLYAAAAIIGSIVGWRRRPLQTPQPAAPTDAFGNRRSSDEPLSMQYARAEQPGRGRHALSVRDIPWRGWKDIAWRVYAEVQHDRLLLVAAGVVFYGLLATFPAITAFVSLYGLFADAKTINDHLALLSGIVPESTVGIVREQIDRLVSKGSATLGFAFFFGLAFALWSANAGVKALIDGLNLVYEEDELRGFVRLNAISLTFTIGLIGALLLAIAGVVILPLAMSLFGLSGYTETIASLLRWPVLVMVLMVGIALVYRFGPNRTQPRWQWISVGSLFASIAWLGGSMLLSWYLGSFANYDATYGSLAAAIGLMMWLWMSAIVVLVGAEINAEIEHQTACDTTVGPQKPLGTRGATMADTVGAARAESRT